MSLSQITGSLMSMQSAMKSASVMVSAKTELKSQALVYTPSFACKGDPQKAAALNDKADNVEGKIGSLCTNVQKGLTDSQKKDTDAIGKDDAQSQSGLKSVSSDQGKAQSTKDAADPSAAQNVSVPVSGSFTPAVSPDGIGSKLDVIA